MVKSKSFKYIISICLVLCLVVIAGIVVHVTTVEAAEATDAGGKIAYKLDASNNATITGYDGSIFNVPTTVDGYPVVAIGDGSSTTVGTTFPNLKEVYIPDGITLNDYVFGKCLKLEKVELPNDLKILPQSCFNTCPNLTDITLPNALQTMSFGCFQKCTSLASIVLPNSLTTLGTNANSNGQQFAYCESLKSITIPSGVTSLPANLFAYCSSLESVTLPSTVKTFGVNKSKQGNQFAYCSSLKTVNIPSGVTEIPYACFKDCSSLETITLPNTVKTFGKSSSGNGSQFSGCSSLKTVNIPSSITILPAGCFNECVSLEEISLPSSLTTIGDGVFNHCEKLKSITIPSKVSSLGEFAFDYCYSLESVNNFENTKITQLKSCAFRFTRSLESISFPSGLTSIGESAFYGSGLKGTITIPKNVKIASNTNGSFNACPNLEAFVVDPENTYGYYTRDGVIYTTATNGVEYLEAYPCGRKSDTLVLGEYTVVRRFALEGSKNLKYIDADNSKVYKNDRNLTGPERKAFLYTNNYYSLQVVAGGIKLDSYTIDNSCGELKQVYETVNVNGTNVSLSLDNVGIQSAQIKYIYVPASLAYMENESFGSDMYARPYKDTLLGVTIVGQEMQDGVIDLSGTKVSSVYAKPFSNLMNIRRLILPSTVKTIYHGLCCNCDNMEEVVLYSNTVVSIATNGGYEPKRLFDTNPNLKKIYVPDSLVASYNAKRADTNNEWSKIDASIEIVGISTLQPLEPLPEATGSDILGALAISISSLLIPCACAVGLQKLKRKQTF